MNKIIDDFEETFWSLVLKDSEVTTVIGGDFNMDGESLDERAAESTFFRVPYEESSSFRKLYLGSYQGSSIDHVLSNRGRLSDVGRTIYWRSFPCNCGDKDGFPIGDKE